MNNQENKIECKICEREFKYLKFLSKHIKYHNISSEEYYNKYLKKSDLDGICLTCKNKIRFLGLYGYHKYCSNKCAQSALEIQEKKKKTCLKNNGTFWPIQSKKVQEKGKITSQKNFGTNNPMQSEKGKKLQIQGVRKSLGVDYAMQSKEIQKKYKQNYKEKTGYELPSQNPEIIEKMKQTVSNRTLQQNKEIIKKRRQTNIRKYNGPSPYSSKEVQEKGKQTSIKNYGYESWTQTQDGRKFFRVKAIKETETRKLNNEPLMPNIGLLERECLNEFEKIFGIKIIRNDHCFAYIIGRIPDGHLEKYPTIVILFDEGHHFIDKKEQLIYNENSTRETKDYESIGITVFRISIKRWLENKEEIIISFKELVNGIKQIAITVC
jgi:hypothetical protein